MSKSLSDKSLELDIEKKKAELEKIELEKAKLVLESKELKRQWWKKPQIWIAAFPAIAALATFFIFLFSGTFDRKKAELQASTDLLKIEKIEFKMQVDTLHKEKDSLQKNVHILRDSFNEVKTIVESYNQDKMELQKSYFNVINNISKRDEMLANAYASNRKFKDSIIELKRIYETEKSLTQGWYQRAAADSRRYEKENIELKQLLKDCSQNK